jgi:hypothetical protein
MRVFIVMPITNDVKALLQDRVLLLCGVGSWHNDIVVGFVAMDAGRYRVVGILEEEVEAVSSF